MTLVAYVSGHGLGHSAREVEILRHVPKTIPLVVKTTAPEWFWRNALSRPFELVPVQFDVGCQQNNGMDIDVAGTLHAWQEMNARNKDENRYQTEADDLTRRGAKLVLSDVASLPLVAARRACVRSLLVANFTWADIYRGLVEEELAFAACADALETEYAQADLLLDAGFALPMAYVPWRETTGLVARPGVNRRDELRAHLPPDASGKRLALVYVGGWGLPIPYERAETFTNWHFLSLHPPPVLPSNWSLVSRDLMPHPDLVASVDLVVSKPGYGLSAECLQNGTPLLYPPRQHFVEYNAIDRGLHGWPGRFNIPLEAFLSLGWQPFLDAVPALGAVAPRLLDGAERAAEIIMREY